MSRPRRRPLGALFALLAGLFGVVGVFALAGRSWIIAFAAGALCAWMAELSFRMLR